MVELPFLNRLAFASILLLLFVRSLWSALSAALGAVLQTPLLSLSTLSFFRAFGETLDLSSSSWLALLYYEFGMAWVRLESALFLPLDALGFYIT